MHENNDHIALKNEIERGHFVRASLLAEQMGLPEEKLKDLRSRAIGQMSAINRNVAGSQYLARKYGFSKEELKEALEAFSDEMKKEEKSKFLEPCYDYRTGKYFSFEEWVAHYLTTLETPSA